MYLRVNAREPQRPQTFCTMDSMSMAFSADTRSRFFFGKQRNGFASDVFIVRLIIVTLNTRHHQSSLHYGKSTVNTKILRSVVIHEVPGPDTEAQATRFFALLTADNCLFVWSSVSLQITIVLTLEHNTNTMRKHYFQILANRSVNPTVDICSNATCDLESLERIWANAGDPIGPCSCKPSMW